MPEPLQRLRSKIKRLARALREEDGGEQPDIPDGLPVLQPRHHRVLKELPFDTENGHGVAPSSGPFFRQLPPEIRRQIYIEAFGDRTVHMGLEPAYIENRGIKGLLHALSDARRDYVVRRGWVWWSSVCHRPPRQRAFRHPCCHSRGCDCEVHPKDQPGDHCFIGIMGWLLTCRQAYMETIEILYHTNTIHIQSIVLPLHLPRLVPRQHLNAIASLQLVLDLKLYLQPPLPPPKGRNGDWCKYQTAIKRIPTTFPSLQALSLSIFSINPGTSGSEELRDAYDRELLGPLDSMIETYSGKLKECFIALGATLYQNLMDGPSASGGILEKMDRDYVPHQRFWRAVRTNDDLTTGLGYWIRKSREDWSWGPECCVR